MHERHFSYGAVDAAFAAADTIVESSFVFPRWSCTPVECYGVIADWRGDGLTAWANFQGPFTLHGVAAAALGIPAARLRLLTPPDSGGSFGIKAGVYVYVVLLGLVSRALGVPVRWTEDRLEHLAASAHASGRTTTLEAAFASDGELLGLRWDAREDVGAYVRAPEPATLYRMHGSLSGAYRVQNVAARNVVTVTNRCPTGLNRGFGGPQLYFPLERTMDIAAARLGLDPAELRRRNLVTSFPHRTPSGASYDAGDYLACLEKALDAVGYDDAAGRTGRGSPDRARHRLHRRAVGLEHGLHHARPDARGTLEDAAEVGERRGLHPHGRAARRHLRAHLVDAAGPGASHGDRPDRRGQAGRRAGGRRGDRRDGHLDQRVVGVLGRVLVALLGRRRRGGRARGRPRRREGRRDPRASRRGRVAPACRRRLPLEPGVAAGGDGAGPLDGRLLRGAGPATAGRARIASRRPPRTGSSSMSRSSRSTSEPARCTCSSTRPCTTPGAC